MTEKKQRKLTDAQKKAVSDAHCCICIMCSWEDTDHGRDYWSNVKLNLSAMLTHGTTDGKPYVELQPEIGEGYRVATEADKDRKDRDYWNKGCGKWLPLRDFAYFGDVHYRVPIDRIPTDDDARERRPMVMVRDYKDLTWSKAKLLGVSEKAVFPFCVIKQNGETSIFRHCRFPYPGE